VAGGIGIIPKNLAWGGGMVGDNGG
jgi:hypothetical protein